MSFSARPFDKDGSLSSPSPPTLFGCARGTSGRVVVIGLPFDQGSASFPGCSRAPSVLRGMTSYLCLDQGFFWDLENRETVLSGPSMSDIGDLRYRATQSRSDYLNTISSVIEAVLADDKIPFVLGGDHLVTLGVLRGMLMKGSLQVVHLDAHTDYQEPVSTQEATHANFMGHVSKLNNVERVIQVGIRGFGRDLPELPPKFVSCSVTSLADELLPSIPVYITIDTDVFDPAVAPGVSYPVARGLHGRDLEQVLDCLRASKNPVVGADWVEYNPSFDHGNHVTAAFIVPCLANLAALLLQSQRLVR